MTKFVWSLLKRKDYNNFELVAKFDKKEKALTHKHYLIAFGANPSLLVLKADIVEDDEPEVIYF